MKIFQLIDLIIKLFKLNKRSKVVLLFLVPTFLLGQNQAFWLGKRPTGALTNLLLDDYPGAAAAYSVRKLDKDYTGFAMEIRRASDNATQNIGFVGEDLDEVAINSFCSGTTCYVRTWYDQSGNGYNATQTTDNTKQPIIYLSGSIVFEGGIPALDFDGTNDFFTNTAPQFTTNTIISVSLTDTESLSIIAGTNSNVLYGTTFGYIGSTDFRIQTEAHTAVIANNINFERIFYAYNNGSSSAIYANQILKQSGSQSGTFDYNIIGGRQSQNPLYYNGTQQELIIYSAAKTTSVDIIGIHSDINSYYSIY